MEKISQQHSSKIYIAAAFMIIFWGSAYVGIRVGLRGYSPGAMALFRYIIASVCMLIIYVRFLPFRKLKFSDLCSIAILGIFGFSIYNIALNYGEMTVTASIASFVLSQIPVIITLFSIIFLKDRLTWSGWIGTCISFIGITLMAFGEGEKFHIDYGVIYTFIATLSGSVYSILQKPLLLRTHPIEFTAYAIWFGTLAMMIYLPQLIHQIPQAPLTSTLAIIYNGIFPAAIGYLLWGFVLANMSATKAAAYLYIVPFAATILAAILIHEIPSMLAITGGLVALLGVLLVKRGSYAQK